MKTESVELREVNESENINKFEKLMEEKEQEEAVQSLDSRSLLQQKCLKLMNGKAGGGFYVRYLQDDRTKIGWLQFVIEYPDGTCKDIILYKNQYQETTFDSDGIWMENKQNAKFVTAWRSEKALDPYVLDKYESPDMKIPGQVLWNKICINYERIPVVKINQTSTIGEVYSELVSQAIEWSKMKPYEFMNENDRCFIPKEMFDQIAGENNFSVNNLKNTFDLMGMFIKDKGTKGYQFSKKIDGKIQRFYALRKTIAPVLSKKFEMVECEDLNFETTVITALENERQRYEAFAKRVRDVVSKEDVTKQDLLSLML